MLPRRHCLRSAKRKMPGQLRRGRRQQQRVPKRSLLLRRQLVLLLTGARKRPWATVVTIVPSVFLDRASGFPRLPAIACSPLVRAMVTLLLRTSGGGDGWGEGGGADCRSLQSWHRGAAATSMMAARWLERR